MCSLLLSRIMEIYLGLGFCLHLFVFFALLITVGACVCHRLGSDCQSMGQF